MFKHLESYIEYSDRYDRLTVEDGRRLEKSFLKGELPKYRGKKLPPAAQKAAKKMFSELAIYFLKGEEYLKKSKTIEEWMERDRKKDEHLERVEPFSDIHCLNCSAEMECIDKDLMEKDKKDMVLMMYECPKCHRRRAFYEDKEEFKAKPILCEKCNNETKTQRKRRGNKLITTIICKSCGHRWIETLDLSTKKKKLDKKYIADRNRFCLTKEEGEKYREEKDSLIRITDLIKKWNEEEKQGKSKDELSQIKKLNIADLESLLKPALEKKGFSNLDFSKPEFNYRGIMITFSVRDKQTGRSEYDSTTALKRTIDKTLLNTNWRLMTTGINYQLGFLSSRLRGVEKEKDLLELIRVRNKVKRGVSATAS